MQILLADAVDVRSRHFLDPGPIAFQEIRRITIELIRHALAQDFVGSIEIENECIQDRVLRARDLLIRDRIRFQLVYFRIERLYRLDGTRALRSHG